MYQRLLWSDVWLFHCLVFLALPKTPHKALWGTLIRCGIPSSKQSKMCKPFFVFRGGVVLQRIVGGRGTKNER